MLRRVVSRSFKSWNEYRAEQLGLSLEEYEAKRESNNDGAFQKWKRQVATASKIDFLLDHCSKEEKARYLKEFSTAELAVYLKKAVSELDDKALDRLLTKINVKFHTLPILNPLMSIYHGLGAAKEASKEITERAGREVMFKRLIDQKLNELEITKLDKEINSVHIRHEESTQAATYSSK